MLDDVPPMSPRCACAPFFSVHSQCVLEKAARKNGISVKELLEVPEGSTRRNMHDDITCVVFFMKGNRSNDGFTALQGYKVQGVKEKQNVENPAQ